MARLIFVKRRPLVLLGLLAVQACAVLYLLAEGIAELKTNPGKANPLTEAPVALALAIGIALSAVEIRRTLRHIRDQDAALAEARHAFGKVVGTQFTNWNLTKAERDVGLLALRGMDVAEIATLRNAAPGTVRAQLARIYAKAGVSGRAQFAAFFVEDLLAEGLAPPTTGKIPA